VCNQTLPKAIPCFFSFESVQSCETYPGGKNRQALKKKKIFAILCTPIWQNFEQKFFMKDAICI
jgi:hypothetical protein